MAESREQDFIQGALIISCTDLAPKNLISKILDSDVTPTTRQFSKHHVNCYPWHIENKYYTADINLFDIQTKDLISQEFANSVHGVIIYFDNDKEESFTQAKSWLPYVCEYNPEIRILICDTAKDDSNVNRKNILEWCIENEFELVEFDPESFSDDEVEDDFKESNGVTRVLQALQAYSWPNMELKNSKSTNQIEESNLDDVGDCLESFEKLFSKFSDLKRKAMSLEGEERKNYAEKVAIEFWNAIGGDEDEIKDLEDDKN